VLQRVYLIIGRSTLAANRQSSFYTAVIQRVIEFVDAARVNLRKHRSATRRCAVPNLGVTCPHFFRCEAPRLQFAILKSQRVPKTAHLRSLPRASK